MNCSHNYSGLMLDMDDIKSSSDIDHLHERHDECLEDRALQELINIPSPLFISKPDITD